MGTLLDGAVDSMQSGTAVANPQNDQLSQVALSHLMLSNCSIQICICKLVESPHVDVLLEGCNECFATEFGMTVDKMIGMGVKEILPAVVVDTVFVPQLQEAKSTGTAQLMFRDPQDTIADAIKSRVLKIGNVKHLGSNRFCVTVFDATSLVQELEAEQIGTSTAEDLNCVNGGPSCASHDPGPSTDVKLKISSKRVVVETATGAPSLAGGQTETWRTRTLRSLAADLERSEERYRRLQDAECFGMGVADKSGRVFSGNDTFFRLLGYDKEAWKQGKLFWNDKRNAETIEIDRKAAAELKAHGKTYPYERTSIGPDGEEISVLIVLISMDPEESEHPDSLHVVIVVDISAQKQAQRQIMEASAMKTSFLSIASHEIRSPLSSVINLLELMRDSYSPRNGHMSGAPFGSSSYHFTHHETLSTALSSSRALLTLLNDILDASKAEAGKLELTMTEFNLQQVVEEALLTLGVVAEAKGVEIDLRFDEHDDDDPDDEAVIGSGQIPKILFGDPLRLRQCILNFTSNAIKFSQTCGKVSVEVSKIQESDEASSGAASDERVKLQFKVSDQGIGISADDLKKIFQPFVQVDSSPSRRFEGCGLGLVVSKKLVELQGGQVSVESVLGKGTTFTFTADFGVVTPRVSAQVEGSTPDRALASCDVHIVALPSDLEVKEHNKGEIGVCSKVCENHSDSEGDSESELEKADEEGAEDDIGFCELVADPKKEAKRLHRRLRLKSLITSMDTVNPCFVENLADVRTLLESNAMELASSLLPKSRSLAVILDIPTCCSTSAVKNTQILLSKLFKTPEFERIPNSRRLNSSLNISIIIVSSTAAQHKISKGLSHAQINDSSATDNPCCFENRFIGSKDSFSFTTRVSNPSSLASPQLASFQCIVRLFFIAKPLRQARLQSVIASAVRTTLGSSAPSSSEDGTHPQLQLPPSSTPSSNGAKANIGKLLVAEDNALMSRIIAMQLNKIGYSNFEMLADGQQLVTAFEKARLEGTHVPIILTDQMMPNMNGFEAAQRIRSIELEEQNVARVPIICLTADAHCDAAEKATQSGIDECLTKPVSIEQLKAVITKWIVSND